jgi:hypothetical protein
LPVAIYGCSVTRIPERCGCCVCGQVDLVANGQKIRCIGNISAEGEIGLKDTFVEGITFAFCFGPFAELLSFAAIVGHFAIPEGQSQPPGFLLQTPAGGGQIEIVSSEKRFQAQTVGRNLRMEGKGDPSDLNPIMMLNLFNTPGNEVAPRSDIV